MVFLWIILALAALILLAAYICYRKGLVVPKQTEKMLFYMPKTEQYAPYKDEFRAMTRAALAIPYEDVYISSYDGLKLHAKLYTGSSPAAPVQILFHGYKSGAERDFCGGLQFAREGGYNVLLVDERAHGKSEGKCLTLGIKERYDCLSWVNYAVERFGAETKILLYGMSMGATTVLMATGLDLPKNVVGVAADCGYTSPSAIVKKVLADAHAPVFLLYPLARLCGLVYGGFDVEEASAPEALAKCKIPALFVHGGDDRFVPCDMGRENYAACASDYKRLLIVPGAGHGLSYMLDKKAYLDALHEFQQVALEE